MRGIFAILILLFLATAATASKYRTGRRSKVLERNNLLIAHPNEVAMDTRYYRSGSSGLPVVFPFSRLPGKEAEESFLDIINQKIIEQGVLQALAVDMGYTPGSG